MKERIEAILSFWMPGAADFLTATHASGDKKPAQGKDDLYTKFEAVILMELMERTEGPIGENQFQGETIC